MTTYKPDKQLRITDDNPEHDPVGPALVVLMGIAGVGKSSWARARYPHEVACSSDMMRKLISDDEDNQFVTAEAWQVLTEVVMTRLSLGKRAIIDATHTKAEDRTQWLKIARAHNLPTQLVMFDIDPEESLVRQENRARKVPKRVLFRQYEDFNSTSAQELQEEGWDRILRVTTQHQPGQAEVLYHSPPPRYRELPSFGARIIADDGYDLIGDVHGCKEELCLLLEKLGWRADPDEELNYLPPESKPSRCIIFVGDLTDRGPQSVEVVQLVHNLWRSERAYLVRGNHDDKLMRYLKGNKLKVDHHLQTTVDELEQLTDTQRARFTQDALALLEQSPFWAFLGRATESKAHTFAPVVVAHAAWKPSLMTAPKKMVKWFSLYGPSTGKTNENGYPERLDWRPRYPEDAPRCITGHTPYRGESTWVKNTLCIDTACVFGERLTAWQWPEERIVSQAALRTYCEHDGGIEEQPILHTRS